MFDAGARACTSSPAAPAIMRAWSGATGSSPSGRHSLQRGGGQRVPLSQTGGAHDSLIVTISQSGETADTLAALREARRLGFGQSLAICNVPESSLVRESDLVLMTRAGPEIGVASTKAFTTQLVALMLLVHRAGPAQRPVAEDAKQAWCIS